MLLTVTGSTWTYEWTHERWVHVSDSRHFVNMSNTGLKHKYFRISHTKKLFYMGVYIGIWIHDWQKLTEHNFVLLLNTLSQLI